MDSNQVEPSEWSWEEALKVAIHMNISVDQFNEMTPYELALYQEAFMEVLQAEKQEKLVLTWLGEYYHRIKKLPPLKDEMKKLMNIDANSSMNDEEMFKVAQRLNKQFGGKEKK
jgi:hypothetical protein